MANEKNNAPSEAVDTGNQQSAGSKAGKAVSAAVSAAKAGIKAAAGDWVGAAVEVVKNPAFLKTVIAILLCIALIIPMILFMIGGAIYALVVNMLNAIKEEWNESWEQAGVHSGGSLIYMYTIGGIETLGGTIFGCIGRLLSSNDGHDNSALVEAAVGSISNKINNETYTEEDLLKSGEAMYDDEALAGKEGIVRKQINMIKTRIRNRSRQIQFLGNGQQVLEGVCIGVGEFITEVFQSPALFAGLDIKHSSIDLDTSAFNLKDEQCVKILSAYVVQNDCRLDDQDLWALMDYCGWYALDMEKIPSDAYGPSNIYETVTNRQTFVMEIGGVIPPGYEIPENAISNTAYQLPAPYVPQWHGTFAPQWYYEELGYLNKLQRDYEKMLETNPEAAAQMPHFQTLPDGSVDPSNFEHLSKVRTIGMVDVMFHMAGSDLLISRTEYTGVTEDMREWIASIGNAILGDAWKKAQVNVSYKTSYGATLRRYVDFNGKCTQAYLVPISPDYDTERYQDFLIPKTLIGGLSGLQYFSAEQLVSVLGKNDGVSASVNADNTLSLEGNGIQIGMQMPLDIIESLNYHLVFDKLSDEMEYAYLRYDVQTKTVTPLDYFTTLENIDELQAYRLAMNLQVQYEAVTMETLAREYMGLWPGSLTDTEIGQDGLEYAIGHAGDRLYLKSWTETYRDPFTGEVYSFDFSRQQGYQMSAYYDTCMAIGALIGIDMTAAMEPQYGSGDNIIAVALREYDYYHANNLEGGDRYWQAIYDAVGDYNWKGAGWCMAFVWYCAYQCGYIGPGGAFGNWDEWLFYPGGAKELLVDTDRGTLYTDRAYRPSPGDLIFMANLDGVGKCDFNTNHVGLVVSVDTDGKITTIEGNAGNSLHINTYSHYSVGTKCYNYTNSAGEYTAMYIASYIRPIYPEAEEGGPLFTRTHSSLQPSSGVVEYGDITIFGIGRWTVEQLPSVIPLLQQEGFATENLDVFDYIQKVDGTVTMQENQYTQALSSFKRAELIALYTVLEGQKPFEIFEAIKECVDNGIPVPPLLASQMKFVWKYWVDIVGSDKAMIMQLSVSREIQFGQLSQLVTKKTGIRFDATSIRRDALWCLATTSSNQEALTDVMADVLAGQSKKITDSELLDLLDEKLIPAMKAHAEELWAESSSYHKDMWYEEMATFLYMLRATYTGEAESDEPSDDEPLESELFVPGAAFTGKHYTKRDLGTTMPFLLYTPTTLPEDEDIPLIVWLHGSGGVHQSKLTDGVLLQMLDNWGSTGLEGFNAYILCPHLQSGFGEDWCRSEALNGVLGIISALESNGYNIDTSRIVVAGHSLGGQGAIYFAYARPDIFKKCLSASPFNSWIFDITGITVPFRAYCGTPASGEHDACYELCTTVLPKTYGENAATVFEKCGHGAVPRRAFELDEDGNGRSDVVEWLLDFSGSTSRKPELFDPNTTFTSKYYTSKDLGTTMPFLLYTPTTLPENEDIPLIVWLHGSGSRQLSKLSSGGVLDLFNDWGATGLDGFNAYILCPHLQSEVGDDWCRSEALNGVLGIISALESNGCNIDTSRIVVAGHSLGGQGAIYFAYTRPDIFKKCLSASPYDSRKFDITGVAVPFRAYCGTPASGEAAMPYELCTTVLPKTYGEDAVTVFEKCSHGAVPRKTFELDKDGNGRSDVVEWLLDFS